MAVWFTEDEYEVVEAVCDRLIPSSEDGPGARAAGAADYIDTLLGAFSFDPPRIWAGGPSSGRFGGSNGFSKFHRLSAMDELGWRIRIEGSQGISEREFNGPVVGFQERYRDGLAALGPDFARVSPEEQEARLRRDEPFTALVFEHVCEGMYGAPEYGGNRDGLGWAAIGFAGDVQPRGWSDVEVAGP